MIPIIQRFRICKFIYLLKLTYNPNQHLQRCAVVQTMYTAVRDLSHLTPMFSAEVKQGNTRPSCFSSYCKQILFTINLVQGYLLLYFWLGLSLENDPQTELSSVPKCKKAVMCLREKIHTQQKSFIQGELQQCCWL